MKAFFGIGLFVVIGLITAIVIGFSPQFSSVPLPYDEEQKGLKQEIVIKFSYSVAENTPKGLAAQLFADLVRKKTNNHVKVELFPNGILYNENDEINALQQGNVQMIAPSFSNISEVVPDWMVMDLPFAFANNDAVQEAFHGDIGAQLFKELGAHNMVGMAFWGSGFKQITSNKGPILQPSDLKGLRMRILPSKVIESQYHLFEAKTYPIPFNQIYHSLENGTIDGEENSISNIYSKKLYQVQKYITISNHGYLGYGVLMNKKFWSTLPGDLKKSVLEAMQDATQWANDNAIQINQKQWEEMKSGSTMQISKLTAAERMKWMNAMNPVYSDNESIIGRELIQEVRKLQNKYAGKQPEIN
ncbi:C4-dicarboxylate-binding protein DctB [Paenibacillus baekrokdamisoli]|uniref:C4-dicarboxylate-binding protein DctB n=1 Tax=Paenibacillus baekrokdamisoli TaxID=1712516 RepID=A0A3G9J6M7_9BACL|nr:DctP family TRAP transporter solute-binding subunit [Paenibacillus baekrokdamisoli]MBB3069363.1 C4-dicarboxylate-binding protein DctP [Paenibacillus baekrokdamisoli]BBH18669.1 C4-dicarboxylate-binding protein DctB [Paenibacillus baekrokdamisoli]